MFIVQLALELTVLAALFLMLRKALFRSFPALKNEVSQTDASRWRGQKAVFSLVFLTFGFIASVTTFWATYFSFSILHSLGNYSGVMVISQASLILPSLIIGFYISTVFSKNVYVHLFGMNEYISFDDLYGRQTRYRRIVARVFSAVTIMPAMVLLVLQFNVYLKVDGKHIYTKQMLKEEKVYTLAEIVKVGASDSHYLDIYLANGEKISTTGYSGNVNYLLDHISNR